jgi:anti-anti-sigma factor
MPEPATATKPFTLEIEDRGTTALVRCRGKLTAGHTDLFYLPASQLLTTHKRVIFDLCDLTHMDSMGLGALVRIYVSSKTHGTSIELRNLGQKIRDLLILTNLLPAFTITGERDIRM